MHSEEPVMIDRCESQMSRRQANASPIRSVVSASGFQALGACGTWTVAFKIREWPVPTMTPTLPRPGATLDTGVLNPRFKIAGLGFVVLPLLQPNRSTIALPPKGARQH